PLIRSSSLPLYPAVWGIIPAPIWGTEGAGAKAGANAARVARCDPLVAAGTEEAGCGVPGDRATRAERTIRRPRFACGCALRPFAPASRADVIRAVRPGPLAGPRPPHARGCA